MNDYRNPAVKCWHIVALLVAVWVIAIGMICLTWLFIDEMRGGPYCVPTSLGDEVEPRILAGKDHEVLVYCERHLAYHPGDLDARVYRAVALYRVGRQDEAKKEFRSITGIDTNWAEAVKAYPAWLTSDARNTIITQPEN